jgi:HSP20 family molecular chaperone IbpA
MKSTSARSAEKDSARARLVAVTPLSSFEPDTSALDDTWADHEPRNSYISLKSARETPAPQEPATLAHDVWESAHALLVLVELPGVDPEHVSLSLGSHALYLEVTRPAQPDAYGVAPGHHHLVIEAPDGLAPDAIDASMANGLLRVRVSKEHAGERRLPIASTEEE